jgi:hypothetical protein
MMNESENSFINDPTRKVLNLSHSFHAQQGELLSDEVRHDVQLEDITASIDGQRSRDYADEGISFDTDYDDNVSLNSLHESSDDNKKNVEPVVLTNHIIPSRPISVETKNINDSIKSARDDFLLSMTRVDRDTFDRAVAGLPDGVLYLAASGFFNLAPSDFVVAKNVTS